MLEITAKAKVIGQLAAAFVVVTWGGLQIDFINLPFGGQLISVISVFQLQLYGSLASRTLLI